MKTLISMTDFVLEQGGASVESDLFYFLCSNYAQFLKQPLTLGMFVPCVDSEPFNYSKHGNKEQLEQAKERVLFDGFEILHIDKVRITIVFDYMQFDYYFLSSEFSEDYECIEDLTNYDIILTPYSLKQIGL